MSLEAIPPIPNLSTNLVNLHRQSTDTGGAEAAQISCSVAAFLDGEPFDLAASTLPGLYTYLLPGVGSVPRFLSFLLQSHPLAASFLLKKRKEFPSPRTFLFPKTKKKYDSTVHPLPRTLYEIRVSRLAGRGAPPPTANPGTNSPAGQQPSGATESATAPESWTNRHSSDNHMASSAGQGAEVWEQTYRLGPDLAHIVIEREHGGQSWGALFNVSWLGLAIVLGVPIAYIFYMVFKIIHKSGSF
ncbi:hypothetical protein ACRALDRAFT_206489 [Sodiomyces alcalophilus JCM 7366]|uniref:uncharacterized protein n=1 Tax=Sodiomyces alcalophilus JCM 7366 TaxID=591952 RepID=UPI0039B56C2F